jgi:hypothetical protein
LSTKRYVKNNQNLREYYGKKRLIPPPSRCLEHFRNSFQTARFGGAEKRLAFAAFLANVYDGETKGYQALCPAVALLTGAHLFVDFLPTGLLA